MTEDDRRKYGRVKVQSLGATISGLQVVLMGAGEVELYDISYGGAALSQPVQNRLAITGETVHVDFLINGQKAQNLSGKVIRLTQDMFAIEFIDASKETKMFVDTLISNRMVGLNMNLIDPQFYRGKETFAYWFHGPKSTNLFLWEDQGRLQRATLDLADVALHWNDGKFEVDNKMNRASQAKLQGAALGEGVMRQAAEILSQVRSNVASLEEFKQLIFDKVVDK